MALVVDEQEGNEDDSRAYPVHGARVLCILHHLSDEGERDGHGQADGDDQRRGQEHGVGPRHVAEQGGDGVEQDD